MPRPSFLFSAAGLLSLGLLVASPALAQTTASRARASDAAAAAGEEVFRSTLQAISEMHLTAPTDSALWERAIEGLIESLDDPYAEVFTPDEVAAFEEQNTGNYAGIGVQITQLNNLVTVTAVFRGTPAEDVGMQEGDIIVEIDGVNSREFTTDSVSKVIRGTPGTNVAVKVERAGYAAPIPFGITRAEVHVPTVEAAPLDGGLTYIMMDRFARGAIQEMDSVLREYQNTRGLIIDLRRNPGGYLDEALMLSDLFLSPGQKLASTLSRNPRGGSERTEESWTDRVPPRLPDVPMVVLVDEYSASAAEILAGALQDHDRALVVGQRSFGKGLVQTVMPLPHGRQIRLTTGEWVTPLGRSLHRPRAMDGRPLPEDIDTFPTIRSEAGRELVAVGGIFPDLEIRDDTLTQNEQKFLQGAVDAEVPLPLRIAEFGFSEAQELKTANLDPRLREDRFQVFVAALVNDGLPEDLLAADGVMDYLRWRAAISVSDRMNRLGVSAEYRMQRDPVLAEAARLLREAPNQTALYAAAAAARAGNSSRGQAGNVPPAGGR